MSNLPFPTNENTRGLRGLSDRIAERDDPPWSKVGAHEAIPMMFQVRFHNGRVMSYAYSDLRETNLRDAGCLQLGIFGMEKYRVTIVGRRLTELAALIGMGRIRAMTEAGPRTFERPESAPSIDRITIETLTGP